MIHVVTTRFGRHTIHEALATEFWDHRERFRPWTFEELVADPPDPPPGGLWLWTDMERLDAQRLEQARLLSDRMACAPMRYRQVNRPGATADRLTLLARLHTAGINDFRAFPIDDVPTDVRFPVFLRLAEDHRGPRTGLIDSHDALASAIADARSRRRPGQQWIVVEFAARKHADGLYRKYSALRVGPTVIARHLFTHTDWMIKEAGAETSAARVAEELAFLRENPHRKAVLDVFKRAGVEYGRIDYDVRDDGALRVWEINTNPTLVSFAASLTEHRRFVNADGGRHVLAALTRLERRPFLRHEAGPPPHADLELYTQALRYTRPSGAERPPDGDTDRWVKALPILERRLRFLRR